MALSLKKRLGDTLGKVVNNPLTRAVGETADSALQGVRYGGAVVTNNRDARDSAARQFRESASKSIPGAIYKPAEDMVVNTLYQYPKATIEATKQAFGTGQRGSFADKFSTIDKRKQTMLRDRNLTGDITRDIVAPSLETGTNILSAGATGFAGKEIGKTAAREGIKVALRQGVKPVVTSAGWNAAQGAGMELYNEAPTLKGAIKGAATNAVVGTVADIGLGAIPAIRSFDKATDGSLSKPIVKAGKAVVEAPGKVAESNLPTQMRLPAEKLRELSDYSDYVSGRYKPKADELNYLIDSARATAKGAGIDITSGTPNQINARIGDFLETRQAILEGGFLKPGGEKPKPNMRLFEYEDTPMTAGEKAALKELEGNQVNVDYSAASNELRKLAKESGQPELYQKVMKQVSEQNMSQADAVDFIKQGLSQMRETGTNAKIRMGVKTETPKPQVAVKEKAPVTLKTLNSKIKVVKDKTRKAELVAERDAMVKVQAESTLPDYGDVTKGKWYQKAAPLVRRLQEFGGASKEMGDRLVRKREYAEIEASKAKNKAVTLKSLKGKRFEEAVDVLEGRVKSSDPEINSAVATIKDALDTVYQKATEAGVPLEKRDNYFPHFTKIERAGSAGYDRQIQHLIKTGQAENIGKATDLLERTRQTNSRRKFGSFEKQRLADLPDYPKDLKAFEDYIDEAYSQIAHTKEFGYNDSILNELIDQAAKKGGNTELIRKIFDEADGRVRGSEMGNKVANAMTNVQGTVKLGTSALGNVAQNTNTATVFGIGKTGKNIVKNAELQAKNWYDKVRKNPVSNSVEENMIRDSGVVGEGTVRESIDSRGGMRLPGIRKITAPLFEYVEQDNRRVAALTAKDVAEGLVKEYNKTGGRTTASEAALRKLGVQGEIGPKLTYDQTLQAMRGGVHRTQFRTSAMDLPRAATSPAGRVITQFKRYPYKQTGFLVEEVLKPAFKGDFKPLLRTATIGIPVGLAVNEARDKVTGRDTSTETEKEKLLNAAQSGGIAGIETSLAEGLMPKSSDGTYGADYSTRVTKTLGGPTISDSVNLANAANKAKQGDPKDLERFALTKVPVVGSPIANRVLPYKKPTVTAKDASPADLDKQASEELKALKENVKPGDNSLVGLPNGTFAVTINGEVTTKKTLKEARHAARMATALSDGSSSKVLGEKGEEVYYYKDENGDTKSKPKYKQDFDVADSQNQLDMYVAKSNEDYTSWTESAKSQLKALETLKNKYNQDSQQDRVDDVQKKIETLKNDIKKYSGYGGSFTKGSSGSSIRPSSYKVNTRTQGSLGIQSRSGGSAKGRVAIKARSSAKPKVSLKKSMV